MRHRPIPTFRSRLEGKTAVLLAASEGGQGGLASGHRWRVQPGQLPAGRLALQRTPLLPGRPGQGFRLLHGLVLLPVFIPREARVRSVLGHRLSSLSDIRLRLVVQLLLARSAVGTVREAQG
ncbi:hypothetical protein HRbin27_00329 [bacterium HR27]|nr:hypothetical protein HRbin27_00329 [bacterium HR27]